MRLLLLLPILLLHTSQQQVSAQDTAALIIGGYWNYGDGQSIQNYVELFGCPGGQTDSEELHVFPQNNYLAFGIFRPEDNSTLVCGGYTCTATTCTTLNTCYWLSSVGERWSPAPPLISKRFNFLMADVVNFNKPGQGNVPLVLGYGLDTEIYDEVEGTWSKHRDILDRNWYSLGCLVEHKGKIYSLRDSVQQLDPVTWNITTIGRIPTPLIRSGRCAAAVINGRDGIMTKHGYWYDLLADTWTKMTSPPVEAVAGITNAMWTFRGLPTIFGNPVCNSTGSCLNTQVVQFNPATNAWDTIGAMAQPRTYHTVIEVPASFCTNLNVPTVPGGAQTTTGSQPPTTDGAAAVQVSFAAMAAAVAAALARR